MIALTVKVASYAGALFSSRILLKMSATVYRKELQISIVHSCGATLFIGTSAHLLSFIILLTKEIIVFTEAENRERHNGGIYNTAYRYVNTAQNVAALLYM